MSEGSWVLRGVDPETRQNAVAEAERRGLSLADYLTEAVLHKALSDEVSAIVADTTDEPFLRTDGEAFALRQRLTALERRLAAAAGSLDGAITALDSSLYDVTSRLGEAEAFAGATAEALQQALQEMSGQMAALRLHISDVELNDNVRDQELADKLEQVAAVAVGADRATADLFQAHDALKRAVADDFAAFTNDTADRIDAGLADVRAAADAAAEQADAAVTHLISELRSVRETLDLRVLESAEETRARMRAAFVETAARVTNIAERVEDNERHLTRATDALQARIVDVEDAAQTALEETAQALRQTDIALMGELGRIAQDTRAAIIANREELKADIADLQEGHEASQARLKLIDVAIGNTFGELTAAREAAETNKAEIADVRGAAERKASELEARMRSQYVQARAEWSERLETLLARVIAGEAGAIETQQALRNDIDRVEACTFAALEKLSGDIASSEFGVRARLADAVAASEGTIAHLSQRLDGETAELREQHAGAVARLKLLESGLQTLESSAVAVDARLRDLGAQVSDRIEHAVASHLRDVRAGLEAHDIQIGETAQHVQDVARMLGRISSQTADAANQIESRVHGLEVTIADLRLEATLAAPASNEAVDAAIHALHTRMAGLEQRQAEAFETLRANIADLIGATDRRFAAIETGDDQHQVETLETLRTDIARFIDANNQRLAALEAGGPAPHGDVATQFEDLRHRIEERVLGVELRSVRTMEQVVDAISLIEQRVLNETEAEAKSA